MMGRVFICGCDPDDPKVKNYSMEIVYPAMGEPYLSTKRYNKEGKEICPIHGQPLYGSSTTTMVGPQGNQVRDYHADYVRVYGNRKPEIKSTVEDRRDNRDPAAVGVEFLARNAAQTNGKPAE